MLLFHISIVSFVSTFRSTNGFSETSLIKTAKYFIKTQAMNEQLRAITFYYAFALDWSKTIFIKLILSIKAVKWFIGGQS